jgi:hypothetical protein
MLRPAVHIAAVLHGMLDASALAAAQEHEAAHARHRDPLRLWAAQLVADLQWPSPSAASRLGQWRYALELARDEEARLRGIDGADLAAAIVAVARASRHHAPVAVALTGEGAPLRDRISRLLAPLPGEPSSPRTSSWIALLVSLVCAAFALGVVQGETFMRAISGMVGWDARSWPAAPYCCSARPARRARLNARRKPGRRRSPSACSQTERSRSRTPIALSWICGWHPASEGELPDFATRFERVRAMAGDEVLVVAPVSGVISRTPRIQLGASVRPADALLDVLPALSASEQVAVGVQGAELQGQVEGPSSTSRSRPRTNGRARRLRGRS